MLRWASWSLCLALLASGCALRPSCPAGMTVVASGLTGPRGMALGPDGTLYVAEAGDEATGGRVSRVAPDGLVSVLVAGLPHSVNAGVEDVGAAAVALRQGNLYALVAEGSGELASSLLRVGADGRPEKVADLLESESRLKPGGLGVESNPFALHYAPGEDRFYATDAAANDLVRVDPAGRVEVVAAWSDDPVPTGIARGPDGALYVAQFGKFPHEPGAGRVDRVDRDGRTGTVVASLTMPIGLAFLGDDLYVLEFAAGLDLQPRLAFRPRSGRLLRVAQGRREVAIAGFDRPTALLSDGGGGLLIADGGAIVGAGRGRILRVAACVQG